MPEFFRVLFRQGVDAICHWKALTWDILLELTLEGLASRGDGRVSETASGTVTQIVIGDEHDGRNATASVNGMANARASENGTVNENANGKGIETGRQILRERLRAETRTVAARPNDKEARTSHDHHLHALVLLENHFASYHRGVDCGDKNDHQSALVPGQRHLVAPQRLPDKRRDQSGFVREVRIEREMVTGSTAVLRKSLQLAVASEKNLWHIVHEFQPASETRLAAHSRIDLRCSQVA